DARAQKGERFRAGGVEAFVGPKAQTARGPPVTLVAHAQPAIYPQARAQESIRVLILLVEEIVRASENSDVLVDGVVGSKVDRRIGWGIQPWDKHRRIAVHVDPRTDMHKRRSDREFVQRRPDSGNAGLVAWPAQQSEVRRFIPRMGGGVVDTNFQLIGHSGRNE